MRSGRAEELARFAAVDFEAFYAQCPQNEIAQEDSLLLVLSFDGAGITMLREDLREATRRAAEKQAEDPRWPPKRMKRGQRRNRKRMAEVAAVYAIEPYPRTPDDILRELRPVEDVERKTRRPKPIHKRVWASVEREAKHVIEEAFREANLRDPNHNRRWIVLVDGQETQLSLVWDAAARMGVEVTVLLDLIHVLEYLWKASYCFHSAGTREAQEWVDKRLAMLLAGTSASDVAAGMTRSATLQELKNRTAVDECANYLRKNRELLTYSEALAAGLPIATGVIEGACRYLVRDRMDKTGARWSLLGAEAVLKLRALRTNGDFDEYWRFHIEAEYSRNHAMRYRHADVYTVTDPGGALTRTTRDALGRVRKLDDPDRGTTVSMYDGFGELLSSTDALGRVSHVRVRRARAHASRAPIRRGAELLTTTWTWDTAANGIGKLHTLASPDGMKTYSYNARGQLEALTLAVNGESEPLEGKLGYDAFGRVATITYPDAGRRAAVRGGAGLRPLRPRAQGARSSAPDSPTGT